MENPPKVFAAGSDALAVIVPAIKARLRELHACEELSKSTDAVNVVAPYLLTALITRPDRLVYLSSSMHIGGDASLEDLQWEKRPWNGSQAYSDSKLHDVILAMGVARRWPDVLTQWRSNAAVRSPPARDR